MAYRDVPFDPAAPVYHGSAFPWPVVEQAGAIHVGQLDQADDLAQVAYKTVSGEPRKDHAVILRKGGEGSGMKAGGETRRAFGTPPDRPNNGITELSFNPGVGFHDAVFTDRTANTAHLQHSREADYPRGGAIDESAYDFTPETLTKYTQAPQEGDPIRTGRLTDLYGATQALRENKVIRYQNTMEGDGKGYSYVVPNPDLNLRQFSEEPKPVAGKSYHQTPLFDLASVKNPGPFDDDFHDGQPDWVGMGDRRKPNMSRTRNRNATPTSATRPRDYKDEALF